MLINHLVSFLEYYVKLVFEKLKRSFFKKENLIQA